MRGDGPWAPTTDGPIRPGHRLPHGATVTAEGVNFSIFSRHATAMSLLIFRNATDLTPQRVVDLDPVMNRTFFIWHVFLEGAGPGLYYTWRADGPHATDIGLRFDSRRQLLDPWARSVSDRLWNRAEICSNPASPRAFRGRIEPEDGYDWEGDEPVGHDFEKTIIYELHVGGFTRHPSSGARNAGTFSALTEKIPYLVDLGITDVELMPVMAFDPQDVPPETARRGLSNFWGYSPYGFFAPHPRYAASSDARREFRDMVKAFHHAGIGVILDVVFNHTAEGGPDGPTIHFRGLGNETFYHLDPVNRSRYRDYTGCGNTLNCNHPVVADYLVRCLEYWVREMHVDGFRFDLASVMARGEDGEPMYHAPVLWAIEFSPTLADAKLIAEAWDAQGLYQVGDFPGFRWAEWNGRYRDILRRAVRGDTGLVRELATRVTGSSDLHQGKGKLPINSINYVTCHDGFTLMDLVSYNRKHNEANGERNRDGMNDNLSWNCGVEGPTTDPGIMRLRSQQARNYIAILLLSQGLPMLSSGDEVLRSQKGNNNPWCQDNELTWFDWSLVEKNSGMLRFVREMIALRKRHASLCRRHFLTGKPGTGREGQPDVAWHGKTLAEPDWDSDAPLLRFTLSGRAAGEGDLHVVLNLSDETLILALPPAPGHQWYGAVATWKEHPNDIVAPKEQTPVSEAPFTVQPRSVAVLESRPDSGSRVAARPRPTAAGSPRTNKDVPSSPAPRR
jgi:isoamylase